MTLYNVSIWADELNARENKKTRIFTFKDNSRWNNDFIVFYSKDGRFSAKNPMDLYKYRQPGYIKKHYSKVPQKYFEALCDAR